ncbi:OmpA family protein [Sulfurospirillum sp. 1612]|uniref:OmpA family protein n=1 Tax=Sulfurospirillum sp. 1612 TaxID=3094835 RepID=UPI002F94C779
MNLKQSKKEDVTNFWVSYADLMAGLLFVFILLIGAIVTKSIILKHHLLSSESSVEKTKSALQLKNDEIQELKGLLFQKNTQLSSFSNKIVILQSIVNDVNASLLEKEKSLEDFKGKVLVLSNELNAKRNAITLKDEELLKLLTELGEKETRYDRLVAQMQSTKEKIKNLTGIRIKVISELKKILGKNIQINPKNGSLRFSSNILFDKGKSVLKESSKQELKKVFIEYVGALLNNPDIKGHIDKIIIEGHTDSDGGFLYNLELSQKRAYEVMNYLLSLDFVKKHNIKSLMIASGRSYLDPIYNKDGKEDKEASRRIEIKFSLKNQSAMKEIERILDAK